MKLNKIEFEETKRFSSIFLDYLQNKKELQKHFTYRPNIESFEKAISNRNFDNDKRAFFRHLHFCRIISFKEGQNPLLQGQL